MKKNEKVNKEKKIGFNILDKDEVIVSLFANNDEDVFFKAIKELGEGLMYIAFLLSNDLADNDSGFEFDLHGIVEGCYSVKVERLDK